MSADDVILGIISQHNQAQIRHEFKQVDRKTLFKMSDSELALWQSEYSQTDPHYILAEFEWQRRLNNDQIKATKFAAWLGLAGALAGVMLGFALSQIQTNYAKAITNNGTSNQMSQEKPASLVKVTPKISNPQNKGSP